MAEREAGIGEVIDRLGIGRFQRKLLVICGAGWAFDAMEILLIAFVLPAVIRDWGLSKPQAGFIGTAVFLGMLIGAWFWGTISDYIGRRTAFQATILIYSVFSGLCALAPNYLWLAALRGVVGFGVGGMLPVDNSLFTEFLPVERRGRYIIYLESFWALGTIIAAALAWLVLPQWGWRALLALSAFPAFVVFLIRRHVPESPRYLATRGRMGEVMAILCLVAEENGVALEVEAVRPEPRRARVTVAHILRAQYLRRTLMLWVSWFCISFGYYGVFIWLPGIFVQRGFTFIRTYQYIFFIALAQLPGYFSAAYLVEKLGRKPTLGYYLLLSGVFTYLFVAVQQPSSVVLAAALMSLFSLGAWGCIYAYTPELYPTELRATGVGSASGWARIAGAIAPMLGAFLLPISLTWALTFYAAAFVVGGILVLAMGEETRGVALKDAA